jgi:arabinose-5-phosphate isomerase
MIKELLNRQKKSLDYFFEHLNEADTQKIIDTIFKCKGIIYFTGVGKSALVAKKIALTLTSTGTRSLYLGATNALHGDLGIVSKEDIFIVISKSGESEELLNLIPFLRNRDIFVIGMVSFPNSRIAKACDQIIHLPLEKELCPHGLAPTTSSVIQMLFGDVLAIALMELKKFPLEQYRLNHPAGKIGKRLTIKVSDLMIVGEGIPFCHAEDKLVDELVELSNKKCGCLLVVDKNQHLLGIFTDGDLRRALQNHGSNALETKVGDLMIKTPKTIQANIMAYDALLQMEANQKSPIMVLPVVDDKKKVIGIIKMHDIVQAGV